MKNLVAPLQLRSSLGDHARKVTWLELFFDLIFVAAVAQVAEPLREHYSIGEVLRLVPLFVLIWWAWTGHALFSTRFDGDDVVQRVLTLLQMFAVAAMAANALRGIGWGGLNTGGYSLLARIASSASWRAWTVSGAVRMWLSSPG